MPARRSLGDTLYRPGPNNTVVRISHAELLALKLTTPVLPPPHPEFAELVGNARKFLATGNCGKWAWYTFPDEIREIELTILLRLEQHLGPGGSRGDRLYVIEFQGPRQYLMFGHSTNLRRRINDHQLSATRHGYALLNAWASPPVTNAQPLEQVALRVAGDFQGGFHFRECFYDMPFETGQAVARSVFEFNSGWRKPQPAHGAVGR